VLTALANAIGFSEPLRLKLWGVNCEGDTPQPSHFPYNITVHSLNKNAFDGHGLRLGGAEVYGSSGVLFYEVVPYSLLELRDNVVVELEVILSFCHNHLRICLLIGSYIHPLACCPVCLPPAFL